MSATPDVIALGETMLSMVALDGPLEEATSFRATHGGAESNACVALARSGRSAAWVSRLGADPMGDRILAALRTEGVDVSWVTRDPGRPTGLMLRDVVGGVRYYRAGSAASALAPGISTTCRSRKRGRSSRAASRCCSVGIRAEPWASCSDVLAVGGSWTSTSDSACGAPIVRSR